MSLEVAALIVAGLFIVGFAWDRIEIGARTHTCPRCGRSIPVGITSCGCGYDFDVDRGSDQ